MSSALDTQNTICDQKYGTKYSAFKRYNDKVLYVKIYRNTSIVPDEIKAKEAINLIHS